MHLPFRLAALERIFCDLGFEGQFSALTNRDKTDTEFVGNSRPKQEPTCINADDFVDLLPPATFDKHIDRSFEQAAVAEDGRNILEDDALFRKIGNIAHACTQLV